MKEELKTDKGDEEGLSQWAKEEEIKRIGRRRTKYGKFSCGGKFLMKGKK